MTSTSTPGSIPTGVTCLTISSLCKSMSYLQILIWERSHILTLPPWSVFRVPILSVLVGRHSGPLHFQVLSLCAPGQVGTHLSQKLQVATGKHDWKIWWIATSDFTGILQVSLKAMAAARLLNQLVPQREWPAVSQDQSRLNRAPLHAPPCLRKTYHTVFIVPLEQYFVTSYCSAMTSQLCTVPPNALFYHNVLLRILWYHSVLLLHHSAELLLYSSPLLHSSSTLWLHHVALHYHNTALCYHNDTFLLNDSQLFHHRAPLCRHNVYSAITMLTYLHQNASSCLNNVALCQHNSQFCNHKLHCDITMIYCDIKMLSGKNTVFHFAITIVPCDIVMFLCFITMLCYGITMQHFNITILNFVLSA